MIQAGIAVVIASFVLLGGVAVNESTHGGMSEMIAGGHHHLGDYGGYHCANPEDSNWAQHEAHMHGNGTGSHCDSGHMSRTNHGGMRS